MTDQPARKAWWHRLRLGLSLRVLMALVLLIGGGLGRVTYRANVQRDAVAAIRAAGGAVHYEWEVKDGSLITPVPVPPWRRWLVEVLGPDYLGHVVSVTADKSSRVDDTVMKQIGNLPRLEALSLENCPGVTDAGLANVRGLTKLRFLFLTGTSVKGPGLTNLEGLSRLELLNLNNIASDVDLAFLSRLTALKRLDFTDVRLTDDGMARLTGLTNLIRLQIIRAPITTAGLMHIRGLTGLKILTLRSTRVESLEPLRNMTALDRLFLWDTPVVDTGLAAVSNLRSLRAFTLYNAPISDAGLKHLAGLPALSNLGLMGTRITDAGLPELARLPSLASLSLGGTAVTDAGLRALTGLTTSLLQLDVSRTKVTPAGIAALRKAVPEMTVTP